MRKGMMLGKGKGYKNVIGSDPRVHGQSAQGMKQPQKMPQLMRGDLVTGRFIKTKGQVVSTKPFSVKYNIGDKKAVRLSNPKFWEKGGKNNPNTYYVIGMDNQKRYFQTKKEADKFRQRTYDRTASWLKLYKNRFLKEVKGTNIDGTKNYIYVNKGGKDMPVTEIDEFEAKAEQKKKPSLFSKAKTAYSEYAQKKKEKRASEISQVRKEIRPELEKLNLQHKRVDTLKEQIATQEKKGMDTDKEIDELETEMEQLRELQEKATKINIQDLSNAELRLIAIKHKDDEGFLSGVFGSSNEYQDELIRRIHKEKAVDAEISKAKKAPVKKEESLFGDFF